MTKTNFLTKAIFSQEIEKIVAKKKLSYIEAVIYNCEEHDIDPLDVRKFISPIVKSKIEAEAKSLNFLPEDNNVLPI